MALASVAQVVGASSSKPKGCRFNPQSGCILEATNRCVSLTPMCLSNSALSIYHTSLSPASMPIPPSLNATKRKVHRFKKKKKEEEEEEEDQPWLVWLSGLSAHL